MYRKELEQLEKACEKLVKEEIYLNVTDLIEPYLTLSMLADVRLELPVTNDCLTNHKNYDENCPPMSWWAVSPMLAEDLLDMGEVILNNCGYYLWGRTQFGQKLCSDHVIREVAKKYYLNQNI